MAIQYDVVQNKLTNPATYACRTSAVATLTTEDVANLINGKNPTIPVGTASAVLNLLREVAVEQLAAGNWLKLDRFISMAPSLKAALVQPTDPLPPDALYINFKTSAPMLTDVATLATYQRTGYPTKSPSIVSMGDSISGMINMIQTDMPIYLRGDNLRFDPTDTNQGVWIENVELSGEKMGSFSQLDPKTVIGTFDEDMPAEGTGFANEFSVTLKTKFTTNGGIRTGTYGSYVRGMIVPAEATPDILHMVISDASVFYAEVTSIVGGAALPAQLVIEVDSISDLMTAKLGSIPAYGSTAVFGDKVTISADGAYTIPGWSGGTTTEFNITVTGWNTLKTNVKNRYSRYLAEPMTLTAFAP